MKNKYWALIAASGLGSRCGNQSQAKQFIPILGKPMLDYSLDLFIDHPDISGVMLVSSDNELIKHRRDQVKIHFCLGGESRCETVQLGLSAIANIDSSDPIVLVHDAARPCLHREDLDACIAELEKNSESPLILATMACDTIKYADKYADQHLIQRTINRESVWYAQTPQCAKLSQLNRSMQLAISQGIFLSDEASYLERMGYKVRLLQAQHTNIKVTWQEDLLIATALLQQR